MNQVEDYIQLAADMAVKMKSPSELEKFYNFLLRVSPVELVQSFRAYNDSVKVFCSDPNIDGVRVWEIGRCQELPLEALRNDVVKYPPGFLGHVKVSVYRDCRSIMIRQGLVEAIKFLRASERLGLKDAKDVVEFWFRR